VQSKACYAALRVLYLCITIEHRELYTDSERSPYATADVKEAEAALVNSLRKLSPISTACPPDAPLAVLDQFSEFEAIVAGGNLDARLYIMRTSMASSMGLATLILTPPSGETW